MIDQEERVKELLRKGKKRDARALACKLVSCSPKNEKLKEIVETFNEKHKDLPEIQIEFEKVSEILKIIEKVGFKINKPFYPNSILMCALYLATNHTWKMISSEVMYPQFSDTPYYYSGCKLKVFLDKLCDTHPNLKEALYKHYQSDKIGSNFIYNLVWRNLHKKRLFEYHQE